MSFISTSLQATRLTLSLCVIIIVNAAFPLPYSSSIPSSALRDLQELCYLTLMHLSLMAKAIAFNLQGYGQT